MGLQSVVPGLGVGCESCWLLGWAAVYLGPVAVRMGLALGMCPL